MRTFRYVAGWLTFIPLFTAALVDYARHRAWHWLAGVFGRQNARRYRYLVSSWPTRWSPLLIRTVFAALDIRVEFRTDTQRDRGRPLLVVTNHVSVLDMLVIAALMTRVGRPNVRWIIGAKQRKDPTGITRIAADGGSVFIPIGDRDAALAGIRDCVRTAASDAASVILFPEGTRYRGPKPGSALRWVLPPKTEGFNAAREEAPEYDVLVVTQIWEGGAAGAGMSQAANYVGRRIVVEARVVPLGSHVCPHQFLQEQFQLMDRRIAAFQRPYAAA